MTAPDDSIVRGAVKYLMDISDVTDLLGTYQTGVPYLFQHTLWVVMENTQTTACVISRAGGWAGPNLHNTMRFPRISLELWADPLRDAGNNVTDPGEVHDRIESIFKSIDRYLHRPQGGTVWWGDIRTAGCHRLTEPIVYTVPDGNGLLRLQTFYGVVEA